MPDSLLTSQAIITAAACAPTAEETELQRIYERTLLSCSKQYPAVEYLLSIYGVPFLSKGDITLVQAQAKSGKTTFISLLETALLSGQWGPITALTSSCKTVIFDTEQFIADTDAMHRRMLSMAELEPTDHYDQLMLLNLRSCSFEERLDIVRRVILRERPGLAIVDGIRDLVPDINDGTACPRLVQELMQLASETGCALILVLHNNMSDNTARGWLGKEIINKCGASIECKKIGDVMSFENTVFRRARVPKWQVTYINGIPTCDPTVIASKEAIVQAETQREADATRAQQDDDRLQQIIDANPELKTGISRNDLVRRLEEQGILKRSAAHDCIRRLLERHRLRDSNGQLSLPPAAPPFMPAAPSIF